MHGNITLDSELGRGTKAMFWIPFNKTQFTGRDSPLIDLGAIPDRLQSEMSVSGCASEKQSGSATPPQSLSADPYAIAMPDRRSLPGSLIAAPLLGANTRQELGVEDLDRSKIHVLVVEDKYVWFLFNNREFILTESFSPINQQIALKTIKKFGFSVNAVWNGQEALDYLLREATPINPKPDIILMDVQMPILDGYRATHLIRHHSPYSTITDIRTLPIVAMTASAIQGDREKCKQAGMDDYLAKPVRGKILENMLIKWALEGKREGRLSESHITAHTDNDSNCTDPDSVHGSSPRDANPSSGIKHSSHLTAEPENISDSPFSLSSLENSDRARAVANSSALPGTESEGDRGMQRVEAEEKATSLRDDKLLAASEASHFGHHPTTPPNGPEKPSRPSLPTAALTEENMGRLDREQHEWESHPAANHVGDNSGENDNNSLAPNYRESTDSLPGSTVGSLNSPFQRGKRGRGAMSSTRGQLVRNESDRSQVTITQGNVQNRAS